MARFVEFQSRLGKPVWINPDCVVGVTGQDEGEVWIHGADGENPWIVPGTVAEVLAKLQGDPEPETTKAGDDIAGWWICPTGEACWVIGQTKHGTFAYEYAGRRHVYLTEMEHLQNWTRDPNRKGWEG